jgi:polyisoprenoid-binding protein YceI
MTTTTEQPTATLTPTPGTYTIDPVHSTVGFVARHLMASKVRGAFTEFDGTIVVGETPETSSVNARVKASSISTHQPQRDEHLRSSDFLEASTHPELTLVSKRVTPRRDGHYDLVADLTIRGVTKEVTFDLEFLGEGPGMQPGTTVAGFEATAHINRRDFGVSFNAPIGDAGGLVVSNKIELELNVEATATA